MRKVLVSEGALYKARSMNEWDLNRFLCGLPTCDSAPIRDRLARPALREEGLQQVASLIDLREACNKATRHPLFERLSLQDREAIKNDKARSWDRRHALRQLNIDPDLVVELQRYNSRPIYAQLMEALLAAPPGSMRRAAEERAREWLKHLPQLEKARDAVAFHCPPGVSPALFRKARNLGNTHMALQAQVGVAEEVLEAVSANQGPHHSGEPVRRERVRQRVGSLR